MIKVETQYKNTTKNGSKRKALMCLKLLFVLFLWDRHYGLCPVFFINSSFSNIIFVGHSLKLLSYN